MNANHAGKWVQIGSVCRGIRVCLRYSTRFHAVGSPVYRRYARCLLRKSVAERLCRVQHRLEAQGFGILIWDAYRPREAQKRLWEICPNPLFVAPPGRGSIHSRGAAVDITLVRKDGRPVPMPCDFDTFSLRAHTDFQRGNPTALRNRDLLQEAMQAEGFRSYRGEWWHFTDPDWRKFRKVNRRI